MSDVANGKQNAPSLYLLLFPPRILMSIAEKWPVLACFQELTPQPRGGV